MHKALDLISYTEKKGRGVEKKDGIYFIPWDLL
jgi:hypothetical protein